MHRTVQPAAPTSPSLFPSNPVRKNHRGSEISRGNLRAVRAFFVSSCLCVSIFFKAIETQRHEDTKKTLSFFSQKTALTALKFPLEISLPLWFFGCAAAGLLLLKKRI